MLIFPIICYNLILLLLLFPIITVSEGKISSVTVSQVVMNQVKSNVLTIDNV